MFSPKLNSHPNGPQWRGTARKINLEWQEQLLQNSTMSVTNCYGSRKRIRKSWAESQHGPTGFKLKDIHNSMQKYKLLNSCLEGLQHQGTPRAINSEWQEQLLRYATMSVANCYDSHKRNMKSWLETQHGHKGFKLRDEIRSRRAAVQCVLQGRYKCEWAHLLPWAPLLFSRDQTSHDKE